MRADRVARPGFRGREGPAGRRGRRRGRATAPPGSAARRRPARLRPGPDLVPRGNGSWASARPSGSSSGSCAACPGARRHEPPADDRGDVRQAPLPRPPDRDRASPARAALGPVRSYEELRRRMREAGIGRVFVKLAHGSSASGVVALAAGARRVVATTTAEVVRDGGEVRLYNSRAIRRVEDEREVAGLVDALGPRGRARRAVGPQGRASTAGAFDLRVVVIAGRAEHVVVRMGRGPMTNLHLGEPPGRPGRAPGADGRRAPGRPRWRRASGPRRRSRARCYAGVDLLIAAGFAATRSWRSTPSATCCRGRRPGAGHLLGRGRRPCSGGGPHDPRDLLRPRRHPDRPGRRRTAATAST